MSPFRTELRSGWRNLAAATVGLACGIPAYTPVSSLFFRALEQEFGWSHAVAAGATIAMPLTALFLPLAGPVIDRLGVRRTSAFSVLACVLCYVLLSQQSGQVPRYYGYVIALNLLGCATGPICYTRLVAADFVASRGTALAICQIGIAFFAILLPPVLGVTMAAAGWRGGYWLFAAISLAGGLVAQALMQPHDRATVVTGAHDLPPERHPIASVVFWTLGVAILAMSIASLGVVSQFQSLFVERGLAASQAIWLLSLLAASVVISRLVVGALLDRHDPRFTAAAMIALAAVGALILLIARGGVGPMIVGVALFGISLGAELDLMAYFCARAFGLRHYARNYGALSVFFYVGIFVGGAGFGALRDHSGGYSVPLGLATLLLLLASGLFLMLPRLNPKQI